MPIFDGTNYAFWKVRMRIYLMVQGSKIWYFVLTRYFAIANPSINAIGNKLSEKNTKAMNEILSRLVNSKFMKVL